MTSPLAMARFWTVHSVIAILLAIPTCLSAQPRLREMARPAARERIESLERQRSLDPDFERKLKRAEDDFGFGVKPPGQAGDRLHAFFDGLQQKNLFDSPEDASLGQVISLEPARPGSSIREAQRKLAERGYLRPVVDVDGKLGPRTRKALESFQADQGLRVSGILDWKTESALAPNSFREDLYRSVGAMFRLEDLRSTILARYRLLSPSGEVLYWGDDQPELARKINEASGGRTIYVEMDGFTPQKAEALLASFRIQERLLSPQVVAIPHFTQAPGLREVLFKPGAHLDESGAQVRMIGEGEDAGKFEYTPAFRAGSESARIRIVSAVRGWIEEFMALLRRFLIPVGISQTGPTVSIAIEDAWKELKSRHPELTKETFRREILTQFGNVNLSGLRHGMQWAWS